jgi:hypothetical protein
VSPAPDFARQTFVRQHFQQCLIANAFAVSDLASLRKIGSRQANSDLCATPLTQLRNQVRPASPGTFDWTPADLCFTSARPAGLAHQSASSLSLLNLGICGLFLLIKFTLHT